MWANASRARHFRSHLSYPGDLTDNKWNPAVPFIPNAVTICLS
jgi:hypothetical protein